MRWREAWKRAWLVSWLIASRQVPHGASKLAHTQPALVGLPGCSKSGKFTQQHECLISSSCTDQLELARYSLLCVTSAGLTGDSCPCLCRLHLNCFFNSLLLSYRDITPPGEPLNKNSRPKVVSRFPKLSRGQPREMRSVEPQSGDL